MKGNQVKKSKKSKKLELKRQRFACLKIDAEGHGLVVWQCPHCREFWTQASLNLKKCCPHCHKVFAKWNKDLEVRLSAEMVKIENNIKTWRCPHNGCQKGWHSYTTMEHCPHCGGLLTA
jgi:hypothetical protein